MLLEGRSRNINARRRSRSALIFVDLPDTRKNYVSNPMMMMIQIIRLDKATGEKEGKNTLPDTISIFHGCMVPPSCINIS